jgi:hypothetical protein
MMTPALMEFYALVDGFVVKPDDDTNLQFDRIAGQKLTVTIEPDTQIPIADTLNPSSPNYMHWYNPLASPAQYGASAASCVPVVFSSPEGTMPGAGSLALQELLIGGIAGRSHPNCNGMAVDSAAQMTLADYDDTGWRMVKIRQPNAGESPTTFYDLQTLRSLSDPTSDLVLALPRVGFFTTPAFFANWASNASNQMRVTANQTVIVALGKMFDGDDPTSPSTTPGLDSAHATPGSACFGCHQLLDPTRSIFAATYAFNRYHAQLDPAYTGQTGQFAFQGVIQPVNSMYDLGKTLANHPLFAQAWAQKLCFYANSVGCSADDPEFKRVVAAFVSSNYSWNTLVTELFSSPLITYATVTQSAGLSGEPIAVERRDHLCAALSTRLGLSDVCGLHAIRTVDSPGLTGVPELLGSLPSDGYGRGLADPVLPRQPSLFQLAGMENICRDLAAQVIDAPSPPPGSKQWSSTQPTDAAITDFVQIVMGLAPSDPRGASAKTILQENYTLSIHAKATPTDALKSTFVLACLAPSALAIGF